MIVKECFPTLILMLFPSTNWAYFGLTYIFDKNVPGEWGGPVKKLCILTFAASGFGFVFLKRAKDFFLLQHLLLVLLLYCINKIETIEEKERNQYAKESHLLTRGF